jgi:hypothetical protein
MMLEASVQAVKKKARLMSRSIVRIFIGLVYVGALYAFNKSFQLLSKKNL